MGKVYISSTYEDLKAERERAYRAVQSLGHHSIAMEDYVARDERPLEVCLNDIRQCVGYVGILGWRYGFQPKEAGGKKSITQLEYEEAGKADIPRYMFLSKAKRPAGNLAEIEKFRALVGNEKTVMHFEDPNELFGQVAATLNVNLGRVEVPPLLPYDCDRTDQRRKLRGALRDAIRHNFRRPSVCLLSGYENQAFEKYVECLQAKAKLAPWQELPHPSRTVILKDVRWPKERNRGEFDEALDANLGDALDLRGSPSRNNVSQWLHDHNDPAILSFILPTDEWKKADDEMLAAFVDYWKRWPESPRAQPLLVILRIPYRLEQGFWAGRRRKRANARIRQTLRRLAARPDPRDQVLLLPPLDDVDRNAVEHWGTREDVKAVARNTSLDAHIRRIFEDSRRLAMEPLGDKLREALERCQGGD